MLYFAYGSNLEMAGMRERCPGATALGRATLAGYRLVFRLWADVEPCSGAEVPGGLWRLTADCVAALDHYEDVEGGLYRSETAAVWPEGASAAVTARIYRMSALHRQAPEPGYLAALVRGYRDFGLDPAALQAAASSA